MAKTDFDDIRRECIREGKLYEDPDFQPDNSILFQGGLNHLVKWKRPKELSSNPLFFHGDADYYDMEQGEIGNCWFVSSVACLVSSPQKKILDRVIPSDQGFHNYYCGAFHFHFWQYGKWTEVIIDDRLPTRGGRLIYGQNRTHPNEFWCPLLEKAYAKLHGSYHIIDGGRIVDAFQDMTGGMCEFVPLKNSVTTNELIRILINCQKMNSFMGGAIFKFQNSANREVELKSGLFSGHAYSILKIKEVESREGKQTLLHIRNPWGQGEWKGAWSDGSAEWASLSKEDRYSAAFRVRDDGEFWMSVEDFRKNFDELELCHLTPDAIADEIAANLELTHWKSFEHYGSWVAGVSAGGPPYSFTSKKYWTNPQFELSLTHATKPTTVVISLYEMYAKPRNDFHIAFNVFKLGKGRKPRRITADNFYAYNTRLMYQSGNYSPYRERTLRFVMEPANHVIVPCTLKPDQEADFYMRIFCEEHVKIDPATERIDPEGELIPTTPAVRDEDDLDGPIFVDKTDRDKFALEEFDRLAGYEGMVDAAELCRIIETVIDADIISEIEGFNIETCRCLVAAANANLPKGLITKEDFKKMMTKLELWRKCFKLFDVNRSGTVDVFELTDLFRMMDFGDSKEAVEGIMNRYGGKQGRISKEDFIQGFCRTIQLYKMYKELERTKDMTLTVGEWIQVGFRI